MKLLVLLSAIALQQAHAGCSSQRPGTGLCRSFTRNFCFDDYCCCGNDGIEDGMFCTSKAACQLPFIPDETQLRIRYSSKIKNQRIPEWVFKNGTGSILHFANYYGKSGIGMHNDRTGEGAIKWDSGTCGGLQAISAQHSLAAYTVTKSCGRNIHASFVHGAMADQRVDCYTGPASGMTKVYTPPGNPWKVIGTGNPGDDPGTNVWAVEEWTDGDGRGFPDSDFQLPCRPNTATLRGSSRDEFTMSLKDLFPASPKDDLTTSLNA